MPWTVSVVLLGLWFVGITIPYTLHGYIYLLPALAVIVVIFFQFSLRNDVGQIKNVARAIADTFGLFCKSSTECDYDDADR